MYEPEIGSRRLKCDFPEAQTRRPDKEESTLKCVDFVWLSDGATWLVEIKDPERAEEPNRSDAVRDTLSTLRNHQLTDEHFLPKLFGTYVWMARNDLCRPLAHRYAVLISMERLDSALRIAVSDHIQRSIDAVGPLDRATRQAPIAEVHDLASWNALPGVPSIFRESQEVDG